MHVRGFKGMIWHKFSYVEIGHDIVETKILEGSDKKIFWPHFAKTYTQNGFNLITYWTYVNCSRVKSLS